MIQEPTQPLIDGPSGPRSPRRRGGQRIGLLIAVGLALAVPVVAITATPRPDDRSLAAGASVAPTSSDRARPNKTNAGKKDKELKLNGGIGGSKGDHGPRGPITITAIDGSDLSLATEDGWTRTITVTGATVITKGGQPATVADLKAGDRIRFRQTKNAD